MKHIAGLLSALFGAGLAVLAITLASKPSNQPLRFDPLDALSTYVFSFSWVGGALGMVLGAALLLGYLALWYAAGVRIFKLARSQER
ncbi:hypothetical protein [Thalassorhabdomicrobium marinisediminis]|uniref:Uncharacterized protein n=1 Tax=Thalassorhabdomicrobium marinisediminis TaxID=2170577 RepID=A0A2T7FYR2_9RHOB|nr:hypothetical protein [Thalassorhabdomicrobium marinisediminis]PVA07307.1 hypothetical protein DC363_05540 [Thalassorhabdomicrobium marinisediminis]